jgi:hypothetical protein
VSTLEDLVDDLSERLQDTDHTKVSYDRKVRYLNHGIRATWPRLYRTVRDSTLTYDPEVTEYQVPDTVGEHSRILRVEIETDVDSGHYDELGDFDFVPGLEDPIIALRGIRLYHEGAHIRVTAAKPLSLLVDEDDVFDGPPVSDELPVLYAMALCSPRALDDRLTHSRYSTRQAMNGVDTGEVMEVAQFWFGQFELLLDQIEMPLPIPGG